MDNEDLEIIIETKELAHALTFANSVVEKRHVIAELGNIKLSTLDNSLDIAATDMDLYLNQNIGAQILKPGITTVSTKVLSDIIKKIPDKEIKIKQTENGNQLELIGKSCFFSLPTLPVSQFPAMETVNAETILTIPCTDLAHLIDYTQFSMSTEETRYNLNGIYFHIKDESFYSAATDGHRLAVASVETSEELANFGIIVPRKTVQELVKIVKDHKYLNSDIQISLAVNKAKFVCGNITIISKLIDGQFPEYSSFIPSGSTHKLCINPQILGAIIDRVATVTVDKFRAIKISLTNEYIEISASGEAKGIAKERLLYSNSEEDVYCSFEGEGEMVVGFNPKYLSDVLNVIKTNLIELHLKDFSSPALIKIPDYPNNIFVIMPVKV